MSVFETGLNPVRAAQIGGNSGTEMAAYGSLRGYMKEPNSCTHEGWTDERVEILKREWATGKSAGQIANILGGVTRNSVIGKVHRVGLPKRLEPQKPGHFVLPQFRSRVGTPIENGLAAAVANAEARKLAASVDTRVECSPRVWGGEGCNWIVSDRGADYLACCNDVFARGWCAGHYQFGVNHEAVPAKKLLRDLRRYF